MQLGPAVTHLAEILNYPEPSAQVVKRLLREGGWTTKGARGRHAPHVNATELASLVIAMMVAEQPAMGFERFPHFAALEHDDRYPGKTFLEVLALLLERLAGEDWHKTKDSGWNVTIHVNWSMASIDMRDETVDAAENTIAVHEFWGEPDQPLPYFRGVERTARLGWINLCRIAKVILAGEADPLPSMLEEYAPEAST